MSAVSPELRALREAFSAEALLALRERNEQRAREVREQMGSAYLCHPDNRVRAKPLEPRGLRVGR